MYCITFLVLSCNNTKTTTETTTMKAYLIDGSWEANHIINTPKPFEEMYPNLKPSITFNSSKNQINGISVCNSFRGTFSIDGKSISIDEAMATTRKMCPNMAGEQVFLETLKKVNTYSVINKGNTLNLIMGDIAIMHLIRK